ncbi:SIR2 family protein [Vitiosangium sp. GDMCC 1.1324]|uniref:SIR2 family protein n=1 Tax=Vitiosangium sp. (strain GDMCC 1.1324) TaxID=2138576 RepID=UPI000D34A6A9|nr:SIR2 family protein [Vitiosangium sp. GDMCC 1.1324]PTL85049.1 hypothetical protein DAT35_08395 [Vitiosangium sp. GDMCC 1.1324]
MKTPRTWTIEIVRAKDAGNAYAFAYERQDYVFVGNHAYGNAEFPWDDEVLSALMQLQQVRAQSEVVRRLGKKLLRFLQAGMPATEGWGALEVAIRQAKEEGRPLHLVFRFGAAELYSLPWELVALPSTGEYLGEVPWCIIHYEWPGVSVAPTATVPRLKPSRLLFGWSSAGGLTPAIAHLHALEEAALRGAFEFDAQHDTIPRLSASAMQDALHRAVGEGRPFTAIHLLCHGVQDASGNYGLLWDESSMGGEGAHIDSEKFTRLLRPYTDSIRLVVLCACHSGHTGPPGNVLGSVAQATHRIGVRAVLASRLPLSVKGSIQFTESFYRTWDGSDSVQPALAAVRTALLHTSKHDWASIQLFAAHVEPDKAAPATGVAPKVAHASPVPSALPGVSLPKPVLEAYRSNTLALFIGSGLSLGHDVKGGLPTWTQIPERLLDVCGHLGTLDEPTIQHWRNLFKRRMQLELMLAQLGALRTALGSDYPKAIDAIFRPSDIAPGSAHQAVARLGVRAILTTNYDSLIEDAGGTPRRYVYTWKDSDKTLRDLESERNILLKVHGTAEHYDSVVMTEREYHEAHSNTSYQKVLDHLLQRYTFLFIGYGLNDPLDLDLALKGNADAFKSASRRHYAVMKDPSDNDRDRYEREYNVRVIPYSDHAQIPAILEQLRRTAGS